MRGRRLCKKKWVNMGKCLCPSVTELVQSVKIQLKAVYFVDVSLNSH